jgi:hypothetical protein
MAKRLEMTTYDLLPRRVNFGWINEAYRLVMRDRWVWIFSSIIYMVIWEVLAFGIQEIFITTGHPLITPVAHPFASTASAYAFLTAYYWQYTVVKAISLPVTSFFGASVMNMANKSVRGEKLAVPDVFSGGPNTLKFIVLNFVIMVAYDFGTIFGLFFGGLVIIGLVFPAFSLAAKGEGAFEAIADSYTAMKKDWLRSAEFVFVLGLIVVLSYCFFCLPTLVTIPMFYVICALAARDMLGVGKPAEVIPAAPGSWPPPPNFNLPSDSTPREGSEGEGPSIGDGP